MSILEKTTVFAEGLDHPECIAYHPDGTIWAGGEAGQIYKISVDGSEVKEVANTGGFILGIAFSADCSWMIICDLGNKCLMRLDMKTFELTEFSKGVNGHHFNIPNYACFDTKGDIYVSESGAPGQVIGKVLKYNSEGLLFHAWDRTNQDK
jgi:gluconolactonase